MADTDGGPILLGWWANNSSNYSKKKTCKQWNMMKYVTSFMGIFVLPKQATTSSQKSFQIWFTCLAGRTSCWGAELTWRHHLFAEKPLTERGLFITLPEFHLAQIWRKFTNRKWLTWQEGRPDENNRWRLCSFCFMHHVMSFHRFHRATTEAHVNNSTLHPYFFGATSRKLPHFAFFAQKPGAHGPNIFTASFQHLGFDIFTEGALVCSLRTTHGAFFWQNA